MSDKEFQMTGDETKKLAEALKKEEFRKLLVEYANEISDPENKKRYEEEITQLEKERGYNVKFLNPTPGFVVKTKFKNGWKVFINIATNSEIQPPTAGPLEILPTGQVGKNWSMPYSLVPAREAVDANKQKCTIYDCIFHPKSFEQAEVNPKFKEMLVTTALDGIENELNTSLERKSLKFPKSSYKGTPSASVIRKPNEKEKEEFDKKVKTDPIQQLLSNKPVEVPKPARDPTLPEHTIKYRGYFDMQDYTVDIPESKGKPKEIVISVMLPKLETIRDLELEVKEKAVMLYHNSPRYKLEIPLSYVVSIKEAQAKFIRDVRQLELVLPILHTPPLALPPREIPATIPCPDSKEELAGSNNTLPNGSASEGTSLDNEMAEVSLKLSEKALQTCNYDSDDVTSGDNLDPLVSERTEPIESSDVLTSDETTKVANELPPLEYRQTFKQIYFSFTVPDFIPEKVAAVFRCNEVELCFETYSLSYQIDIRLPTECVIKGSTSECRLTSNGIVLKVDKLGVGNRMWDTFRIGCRGGKLEERKFLTETSILREVEQVGDVWNEDNASLPMSIRVNKEDTPLFIELDMKGTEHNTVNNANTITESLLQQDNSIEGPDSTTNETSAQHDVTADEPKTEAPGALLATLSNDLIYELND